MEPTDVSDPRDHHELADRGAGTDLTVPDPVAGTVPGAVSEVEPTPLDRDEVRINDLAFKVATVNGTGSSSANNMLMKAIFRMGVPVSGKNVFPSNIQGLPTWYEIRVNGRGYTARTPVFDLIVAMNRDTYARDVAEVRSGGWILYDSSWPMDRELSREDVTFLGVPLARMCVEAFTGARERVLMKNIAYVGALAALLDLEMDVLKAMVRETFAKKQHLMDSNFTALDLGHDYAAENFDCPLPVRVERMDATAGHVILDGNTAAALGCVYAGATVGAWYPITPATSVMDGFKQFAHRFRTDPETGKKRFCILQAEDELAAAGMVIGAGWAGARAFTPTSGAGISLMTEFIGLAYYAEIPSVFFDIQRTGPSTGMPTRTQQGDLLFLAYASHGDTKHICVYPANPEECFEMAVAAFDLAERFQTPVFVVSDLDIGMNDWMCRPLEWDDDYVPDRGKVLDEAEIEELEAFHRYLDTDGDGVAYRTLPGVHPKGAYFTRGSGHDKYGRYTEDSAAYTEVVERLLRKVATAAEVVPEPVIEEVEDSRVALVTVGGCDPACREAMDRLAERDVPASYMRIRAFPFHPDVRAFLERHDRLYVVEQNRDAQLLSLLVLETEIPKAKLRSVRYFGGMPMSAEHVLEGVMGDLARGNGRGVGGAEGAAPVDETGGDAAEGGDDQ